MMGLVTKLIAVICNLIVARITFTLKGKPFPDMNHKYFQHGSSIILNYNDLAWFFSLFQ